MREDRGAHRARRVVNEREKNLSDKEGRGIQ